MCSIRLVSILYPLMKPPNPFGLNFNGSSSPTYKAMSKLSIDCASVNQELLRGDELAMA